MKPYVFMDASAVEIPTDTLVITWETTADGVVLNLDYDSTVAESEAYSRFVTACNEAVNDHVLPVALDKFHWYDWKEISNTTTKQYSVIYSPNDATVVCRLHWDSSYSNGFFIDWRS